LPSELLPRPDKREATAVVPISVLGADGQGCNSGIGKRARQGLQLQ
jgi:hypothetical protein